MSSEPRASSPSNSNYNSQLLSPSQAAHLLGVTPELLFAYARYAPKKNFGHARTLPYVTIQGHEGFRQSDLESFDIYLREPWSESNADRPAIPTYVVDYLKVECGGQCARCGKGYKLENAHIDPYANTQSHHHHNLIRLCSECHEKYDAQPTPLISREEIRTLKDQLVAKVRQRLRQNVKTGYGRAGRMPNPVSQFVGREHEIGVLVEALQSSRSVSIQGPGGIGKTQLLLNALQRISDERPVIWINVEAYSSVSDLGLALTTALSQEGSPIAAYAVVDVLADAQVRVIFDGVERMSPSDMDDLEDFFGNLLTMTFAPQFIFTSQAELNELDIDVRLQVDRLDEAAGMLILRSALDSDQLETLEVERLLKWLECFCEGHPLSLRLTAGLLRYFKSVPTVVERIRQHGASIIQSPTRHRQTTSTSLRTCLLVSYQALTNSQRRVLWLAAHCPAGCILDMLRDREIYGTTDIESDVATLQRWHLVNVWVDELEKSRLSVLSPIGSFIEAEWSAEAPLEAKELHYILVEDFTTHSVVLDLNYAQGNNAAFGLFRFDQEFPNFLHALAIANKRASNDERYLRLISVMASSLMVYCYVRGLFNRGIQIMRLGADASIKLGHKKSASDLLLQLFSLSKRLHSENSERTTLLQEIADELALLAEDSKESRLLGNAAIAKGEVAMLEGELDEALEYFSDATLNYERAIQTTETTNSSIDDEPLSEQDNSARQNLAMALKSQGFVHQIAGRMNDALLFYERSLTIISRVNDEINIGSIHHQIGNCAVAINQFERAFNSYLEAAKKFQAIGMNEYLSHSLSELGYLLIQWDPSIPIGSLIFEDLLIDGLADTTKQIIHIFAQPSSVLLAELGLSILRKTFGIVALLSFSSCNSLLDDWAYELRGKMLQPLHEKLQSERQILDLDIKIPLMHLDLILLLAGTLSEVEQPNGFGSIPTLDEIEYYAWLCYKHFEPGWTTFHLFEWLSTYLYRHRGLADISPAILQDAITETEEYGQPFSLPGL